MSNIKPIQVDVRLNHPTLYRSIMTFAVISIGLGLNFFFTNPTFNPYQIDKAMVGSVFMALGVGKIIFLNFKRNLRMVRLIMSMSIGFMMFWGVGSSITFFQGRTSLQLFVLYTGLSALQMFLLLEPSLNPLTKQLKNERFTR